MSDPDPPAGSEDPASGGVLASLLSTTPRAIGSITALIGAVSGLLVALNKVGILGGGHGGSTTTTSERAATLFGPMTRPIGRVYFDGTTMYVRAAKPGTPLVNIADQGQLLQDVSMSTRVSWVSGARDYGVSLICRYENSSNYYLFGVLSGGRYNIARYRDGKLASLTAGIQKSSFVSADANDIKARCVGHRPTSLTLEVNGHMVGAVKDANGIKSGTIGIRVGSNESSVTCRFEHFVLNHL